MRWHPVGEKSGHDWQINIFKPQKAKIDYTEGQGIMYKHGGGTESKRE